MDLSNRKHAAVRRGQPEGTSPVASSARRARSVASPVTPAARPVANPAGRPAARASHRPATRSSGRLLKLAVSVLSLLVFGWLLVTPGTAQGQTPTATTTTPNIRIELPWLDANGDEENDFMGQSIRVSFTSSPVILRLLNAEGEEITEAQARADGGAQAITLKGCSGQSWASLTVRTEPGGVRTVAIGDGPQLVNVPVGQTESCNYEVGFPRLPGVSLYPGSTIYYSADTEQVPGKKGATVFGSYSVPPSANSRPSSTSPNPGAPLATADSFFTPGVEVSLEDNDDDANNAHERSGATVRVTFYSDSIATNPPSGCSNNVPASVTIQDDGTASLAAADAPELVDVPVGYGGGCRYSAKFAGVSGYGISGGGITTVYATQRTAEVHFFKVQPRITTTYFTPRVEITVPDGFAGTSFDVQFMPVDSGVSYDFSGFPFECNTPEFIAAHRAAQLANPRAPRPEGSSTFTATYTVPATGNTATGAGPRLVNQPEAYKGGGDPLGENDQPELVAPCVYTVTWPEVAGLELSSIDGIALSDQSRFPNFATLGRFGGDPRELRAKVSAAEPEVAAVYIVPETGPNVVSVGPSLSADLPALTQTYFTPTIDINLPSLGSVVGGSFTQSDDLNPNNDYSNFEIWVDIWPVAGTTTSPSARSICGVAGAPAFRESDVGNSFAEGAESTGRIIQLTLSVSPSGTVTGDVPRLVDSPGAYYLNDADPREFAPAPRCEYTYTVAEQFYNELVLRMFDGSPWDSLGAPGTRDWDDEIFPVGQVSATDSTISATYEIYITSFNPSAGDIAMSHFTPEVSITVPQFDHDSDGVVDYAGTTFELKFVPALGASFLCHQFEVVSEYLIAANAAVEASLEPPDNPANTRETPNALPAYTAIYTVQDDGTVTGEGPRLVGQPNAYRPASLGGGLAPVCLYDIIWPININTYAQRVAGHPQPIVPGASSPGDITVPNPCVSGLTIDLESYFTNRVSINESKGFAYTGTENLGENRDIDDYSRLIPLANRHERSGDAGAVQVRFVRDQRYYYCGDLLPITAEGPSLADGPMSADYFGPPISTFTPTININLPPLPASTTYAGTTFTVRFVPVPGSAFECNPTQAFEDYAAEYNRELATAQATARSEGLRDHPTDTTFDDRAQELLDAYFDSEDRVATYYYFEAVYTVGSDGMITGEAPELVNQPNAHGPPNPNFDDTQPVSLTNPKNVLAPPCIYRVIWPIASLSGTDTLRPLLTDDELPKPSPANQFRPATTTVEEAFEWSVFSGLRHVYRPGSSEGLGFTDVSQLYTATPTVSAAADTVRALYYPTQSDPPLPSLEELQGSTFRPNIDITVPQDDFNEDGVNDYAGTSFVVEFYPARGSAFLCNNADHPEVAAYLAAANDPNFNNSGTPRPVGFWPYAATYTVDDSGAVIGDGPELVNQPLAYVGGGTKLGEGEDLVLAPPCSYRIVWPAGSGALELGLINKQTPEGDTGFGGLTAAQIKTINSALTDQRVTQLLEILQSEPRNANDFLPHKARLHNAVDEIMADYNIGDAVDEDGNPNPAIAADSLTQFLNLINNVVDNTVEPAFVSDAQKDASASYIFIPTTFTPRVNIIVPQDETTPGTNDYAGVTFELMFWPTPAERQSVSCWPPGYDQNVRRFHSNSRNRVDPFPTPPYSATYTVQDDGSVTTDAPPVLVDTAVYHIIGIRDEDHTPIPGVTFDETQVRTQKCVYAVWWPSDTGSQIDNPATTDFTEELAILNEANRGPVTWLDSDTTASAIYFLRQMAGVARVLPPYVPLEEDLAKTFFTPNVSIEVPDVDAAGTGDNVYAGTTFAVEIHPLGGSAAECSDTQTVTYSVNANGNTVGTTPRLVDQPNSYVSEANPNFDDTQPESASNPTRINIRLADPCSYRVEWPLEGANNPAGTATIELDSVNGASATGSTSLYDTLRAMTKSELEELSGLSTAVMTWILAGGLSDREAQALIEGLFVDKTEQEVRDLLAGGLTEAERNELAAAIIDTGAPSPLALSAAEIRELASNSESNTVPLAIVNGTQTDAAAAYIAKPELVATYFTPHVHIIVPQKDANTDGMNDFTGTQIELQFRPRQFMEAIAPSYSYWCNNPDTLPAIRPNQDRPVGDAVPPYTATYQVQDDGSVALVSPMPFRLIDEPAAYTPDGTRAPACTYSVKWPSEIGSGDTLLTNFEYRNCAGSGADYAARCEIFAFFSTYLDATYVGPMVGLPTGVPNETIPGASLSGIYFEPSGEIPPYVAPEGYVPIECEVKIDPNPAVARDCMNELVEVPVETFFSPTVNIEVPDVDANSDSNNDYSEGTATSFSVEFWPAFGASGHCYPDGYDPSSYSAADPSTAPFHATYTVQTDGSVTTANPARLIDQPPAVVLSGPRSTLEYLPDADLYLPAPKCVYEVRQQISAGERNLILGSVNGRSTIDPAGLADSFRAQARADKAAFMLRAGLDMATVDAFLADELSDSEVEAIVEGLVDGLTASEIQALAPNTLAPATVSQSAQTASYVYVVDVRLPRSTFEPDVRFEVPQVDGADSHNIYSGVTFEVRFWPTGWSANAGCFPEGYNPPDGYSPTDTDLPPPYTATYTVDNDGNVMSGNVPTLVHQPAEAYVQVADGNAPSSPFRRAIGAVCNYLLEVRLGDTAAAANLLLDAVGGRRISGSTGLERLSLQDIKRLRPDLSDSQIEGLLAGGLTDEEIREIVTPATDRYVPAFDSGGACIDPCVTGLTGPGLSADEIRDAAPNTIKPAVVSDGDKTATFTYVTRPPKLVASYFSPIVSITVPQREGQNEFAGTDFVVTFRPVPDASFWCNPSADVNAHRAQIVDQLQATSENPGAQRPVNVEATPNAVSAHSVTYTVQPDGSVTPKTNDDRSFRLMDQAPVYDIARGGPAQCGYVVGWPRTADGGNLHLLHRDGASYVNYAGADSRLVGAVYHKTNELPPGYIPSQAELDLVATYFTPTVNIEVPLVDDSDGDNIYSGTTFEVLFWPKRAIASSGGVIFETGAAFECNSRDFVMDKRQEINTLYEQARRDLGETASEEDIRSAVESALDDAFNAAVAAVARGQEPDSVLFSLGYYSATYTVDDDGNVMGDTPRLVDQPAAYQGDGENSLAARCEYEVTSSDDLENLRLLTVNGVSVQPPDIDQLIGALDRNRLRTYTGFSIAKAEMLLAGGLDASEITEIKEAMDVSAVLALINAEHTRRQSTTQLSATAATIAFGYGATDVTWASTFVPNVNMEMPLHNADGMDANDFSGTVIYVDFVPTDGSPEECPTRERRAYTIGDNGMAEAEHQTILADRIVGSTTPCTYDVTIHESGWPNSEYDISPPYLESLDPAHAVNANNSSITATFAAPFSPKGSSFTPQADILVPVLDDGAGLNDFAGETVTLTYTRSDDTQGMCTASATEVYSVSTLITRGTAGTTAEVSLVMSTDGSNYEAIVDSLTDDDAANDKVICQYEVTAVVSGTELAIRPTDNYYLSAPAEVPTFEDYRSVSVAETITYQIDRGVDGLGMPLGKVFACDAETAGSTTPEPSQQTQQASVSCGVDFPPAFTGDYLSTPVDGGGARFESTTATQASDANNVIGSYQDSDGTATEHVINIGSDNLVLIRRPNVYIEFSVVKLKTITVSLSTPDGTRSGQRVEVGIRGVPRAPESFNDSECLSRRVIGGEDSCFPRNYQPCALGHARTMMIGGDGSAADVMVMAIDIDGGESAGCEYVVSWPEIDGLTTPPDMMLSASDTTASASYTAP